VKVDLGRIHTCRDLLQTFEPRPIRDERQARQASEIIDSLTDLPHISTAQRDFIGLLGELLHDWESNNEEPLEASPQEVVRSLMDDNKLRQADLVGPVFPSRPAVSHFLAGRRPLSYDRVGKLAAFFHVSPAVFYPAKGPMPRSNAQTTNT
jgi:HTH-type transcriptional regulator / antitoxin HigA